MTDIASLHRSLDQELTALLRGASLECLACGEFVMHARGGSVFCPECGSQLADEEALESGGELTVQAGCPRSAASAAGRGKSGHRRAGRWRTGVRATRL